MDLYCTTAEDLNQILFFEGQLEFIHIVSTLSPFPPICVTRRNEARSHFENKASKKLRATLGGAPADLQIVGEIPRSRPIPQ